MSKPIDRIRAAITSSMLSWADEREAILDLAARLDEAEKRIGGIQNRQEWEMGHHLATCHIIGTQEPLPVAQQCSPDKQEMVERYVDRVIRWSRGKDTLRELLSDFYEEVKHGA